MSDRKLVYKVTVDEILPIEGADKIEVARITGWRVVVQKGEFKAGDTALFFEVDSALSAHDDRFEFLKERCYKQFLDQSRNLFDECLRIKTIKLRGIYSQGLLLPVKQFCEVRNKALGEDCRDVLYVRHYDEVAERAVREVQPFLAANQKGLFPSSFGPKSDEPRCLPPTAKVKTPTGEINIEEIKEGDTVLSVKDEKIVEAKVSATSRLANSQDVKWFKIRTESGKEIVVTGNHLLWLPDENKYERADRLSVGDVLLSV